MIVTYSLTSEQKDAIRLALDSYVSKAVVTEATEIMDKQARLDSHATEFFRGLEAVLNLPRK